MIPAAVIDSVFDLFRQVEGSRPGVITANDEMRIVRVLQQMYAIGEVRHDEVVFLQHALPQTVPALRVILGDAAMHDLKGYFDARRPRAEAFVPILMGTMLRNIEDHTLPRAD